MEQFTLGLGSLVKIRGSIDKVLATYYLTERERERERADYSIILDTVNTGDSSFMVNPDPPIHSGPLSNTAVECISHDQQMDQSVLV
jgi:hypothetical protein